MQKLYAAGFNAWGQLRFDAQTEDEPDDIAVFTQVLETRAISHVQPSLSCTTVTTSDGTVVAGASQVQRTDGYLHFSEALNGQVVDNESSCTRFAGFPDLVQIVAYDVGFAALGADGAVWTWGDPRFPECLGRDVALSPAAIPGRVTALDGLPTGLIVKLAGGGYVLAALTKGQDLYCWGAYPGRRSVVLQGLTSDPSPVVITAVSDTADATDDLVEEADIVDVGVGDEHMIVLTARNSVCVIGSNANGQLGLGREWENASGTDVSLSWIRVDNLSSGKGSRVTAVYAGPRSSFVVVAEKQGE
ncbi:MAG: hypothetical protein STHCBS139747_005922 [Sporothrix thermara]